MAEKYDHTFVFILKNKIYTKFSITCSIIQRLRLYNIPTYNIQKIEIEPRRQYKSAKHRTLDTIVLRPSVRVAALREFPPNFLLVSSSFPSHFEPFSALGCFDPSADPKKKKQSQKNNKCRVRVPNRTPDAVKGPFRTDKKAVFFFVYFFHTYAYAHVQFCIDMLL